MRFGRSSASRNRVGMRPSRRLVSQLLARGVKVRRVSPAPRAISRRNVTDFHRGKAAMKLSVRAPGPRSRRVLVKTRIVNLKHAGPRSIATHLRYIERDGVTVDGTPPRAHGAELDAVDTHEFASRCRERPAPVSLHRLAGRRRRDRRPKGLHSRAHDRTWSGISELSSSGSRLIIGIPIIPTPMCTPGKDSANKDLVIDWEYITHGMRGTCSGSR